MMNPELLEVILKASYDDSMQAFTDSWNNPDKFPQQEALIACIGAMAFHSLLEKLDVKADNMDHAATLLNQAAAQLGLQEKF